MKSYVAFWLQQINEVLCVHSAQAFHGGSGAVYVMLKKNEEKKKKRPFLWIFLGFVLLLSGGTILYIQSTSTPQTNRANHDNNIQYANNSTLDQAEHKTTPSSNTSSLENQSTEQLSKTDESESSTVFGTTTTRTTTTQNEQNLSGNDIDNNLSSRISKFADDTKIGSIVTDRI